MAHTPSNLYAGFFCWFFFLQKYEFPYEDNIECDLVGEDSTQVRASILPSAFPQGLETLLSLHSYPDKSLYVTFAFPAPPTSSIQRSSSPSINSAIFSLPASQNAPGVPHSYFLQSFKDQHNPHPTGSKPEHVHLKLHVL